MTDDKSFYGTSNEIAFLRGLATGIGAAYGTSTKNGWCGHGANPAAFRNYAAIIQAGMRVYDPAVDVAAVKAEIAKLERGLRAAA